tara:strand:- start:1108 stop:1305 length:198 start_codon:yes stop_codon:yes gene_type:complete
MFRIFRVKVPKLINISKYKDKVKLKIKTNNGSKIIDSKIKDNGINLIVGSPLEEVHIQINILKEE